MADQTRYCNGCNQDLPLESFSKTQWSKKSTRRCKECIKRGNKEQLQVESYGDETDPIDSNDKSQDNHQITAEQLLYANPQSSTWIECQKVNDGKPGFTLIRLNNTVQSVSNKLLAPFDASKVGEPTGPVSRDPAKEAETESLTEAVVVPDTPIMRTLAETINTIAKAQAAGNYSDEVATVALKKLFAKVAAQPNQPQSIDSFDNSSNSYGKLLLDEQRISKFTTKFPTSMTEYFHYSNSIATFQFEQPTIAPARIFQEILDAAPSQIRSNWNLYKSNKTAEHLTSFDFLESEEVERRKFNLKIHNVQHFESWVIKTLGLQPNIAYFKKQLSYIQCLINENPKATLSRIDRYYFQISNVLKKINPLLPAPIRSFSDRDKLELFQRVFIEDNCSKEYNNDGKLNAKVKTKVGQHWQKYPKLTLKELRVYLSKLDTEILPPLTVEAAVEGKHWKHYTSAASIFQIRDLSKLTNRKRRAQKETADDGPTKKRRKLNSGDTFSDTPCRFKSNCLNFIKKGKCNYRHTVEELKILQAKYQQHKNTVVPRTQLGNKFKRRKQGDTDIKPKPCNNGTNCRLWQNNQCNYGHNRKLMKCAFCHKPGHSQIDCFGFKRSQRTNQAPPHYDPSRNPNPNRSYNEINAAQRRNNLAMQQQQYFYQQQQPLPPSAINHWQPNQPQNPIKAEPTIEKNQLITLRNNLTSTIKDFWNQQKSQKRNKQNYPRQQGF